MSILLVSVELETLIFQLYWVLMPLQDFSSCGISYSFFQLDGVVNVFQYISKCIN